MIIQSQISIALCNITRIISLNLLLDYYCFSLELNSLKVITTFELDVGHFYNAEGNVLVHWACDLKEEVDGLTV